MKRAKIPYHSGTIGLMPGRTNIFSGGMGSPPIVTATYKPNTKLMNIRTIMKRHRKMPKVP